MTAQILAGKEVAARLRDDVRARARRLRERGVVPLCSVFSGEDDAEGLYYARALAKVGAKVDVEVDVVAVPRGAQTADFAQAVRTASSDPKIHGILVQRPLPKPLDRRMICDAISIEKDVDAASSSAFGLLAAGTPAFVPATAAAVVELLKSHLGDALAGASTVVVGRSPVVGRPVAYLLTDEDATVTLCHSRTRDLVEVCARADVLVVAIGVPKFVGSAHVKRGATVIDVGASVVDSQIVGDVDEAPVLEKAGALSPVPGGVGPITTSVLLRSVVAAAERPR